MFGVLDKAVSGQFKGIHKEGADVGLLIYVDVEADIMVEITTEVEYEESVGKW